MKKYCVPVEFISTTFVYTMAESENDAINKAGEALDMNDVFLLNDEMEIKSWRIIQDKVKLNEQS